MKPQLQLHAYHFVDSNHQGVVSTSREPAAWAVTAQITELGTHLDLLDPAAGVLTRLGHDGVMRTGAREGWGQPR